MIAHTRSLTEDQFGLQHKLKLNLMIITLFV
jgi:hypothetical protein